MRGDRCKVIHFNGAVVLSVLRQGHAFFAFEHGTAAFSVDGKDHGTFEMLTQKPSPSLSQWERDETQSTSLLSMIDLLIATTNPHKLEEISAILTPLGVRAIGLGDVRLPESNTDGGTGVSPVGAAAASTLPEPIEDADTFEGNAAIKARYYAAHTGRPCLADDSGLEVDALNGAPGVRSARYAGAKGDRAARDTANNDKLLRELANVPKAKRTARFVCAMCLAAPDGAILATSRGVFEGVITDTPRGDNGFGYDPLLELPDGRTSAELPPEEKNARSHRGDATRAIASTLRDLISES